MLSFCFHPSHHLDTDHLCCHFSLTTASGHHLSSCLFEHVATSGHGSYAVIFVTLPTSGHCHSRCLFCRTPPQDIHPSFCHFSHPSPHLNIDHSCCYHLPATSGHCSFVLSCQSPIATSVHFLHAVSPIGLLGIII